MIKFSKRLAAAASLLEGTGRVLDVGTDHGYLPVWLAQRGTAVRIAASDLRRGPLSRAMQSAEEYGVAEKIEFFLSDGLRAIDSGFDELVIAGMGGETVISILEPAPWTKNVRLVLQPQSKQEELCSWLMGHGYRPLDALLAEEGGKLYTILAVTGGAASGEAFETFLLRPLFERRDRLFGQYTESLAARERLAIRGLESGEKPNGERLALRRERLRLLNGWHEKWTETEDFYVDGK